MPAMRMTDLAMLELVLREALDGERGETIRSDVNLNSPEIVSEVGDRQWTKVVARLQTERLLKSILDGKLDSLTSESCMMEQLEMFALGVAALQLFVAANWAGEGRNKSDVESDGEIPISDVEPLLVLDGESLCPVAKRLHLLLLARSLLCNNEAIIYAKNWIYQWWALRVVVVHQQVLSEKSEQLHAQALNLIQSVTEHEEWKEFSSKSTSTARRMRTSWMLEVAHFHAEYYEVGEVRRLAGEAASALGVNAELTGAMGKRTKFQQRDLPQLTVDFSKKETEEEDSTTAANAVTESDMPADVKLNDEVRLEKIEFAAGESARTGGLSLMEQALFLTEFTLRQRMQPKDELTQEELSPYLDAILESRSCWSIKTAALLHRSVLEADHRRSVERALAQVETLVESIKLCPPENDRLRLVYCSRLPPSWQIEGTLCKLLLSLGSTKAALDVALRLKQWEDVIACYHQLQLRHKAAEVIREEMERRGESPLLLCMLGDATDDLGCYDRAVEMSGGKSARAFRSIGTYHYFRQDYAKAVEFLDKSVLLSPYQPGTLLRLGYSAMQTENWDLAARTYRRYCSYEFDNFEAWNNLSNAYVKLGQKARAWKVLQEAVKCDFDNWKIWDNIMVVSTDCAHFEEVLRAYHRLLDLKEKHVDLEVLGIMRKAICQNLEDNSGRPCVRYLEGALKLMGRITSQVTTDGELWEIYSDLSAVRSDGKEEVNTLPKTEVDFKVCQRLQKASACMSQKSGWERDKDRASKVLKVSDKYAEATISFARDDPKQGRSLVASARMSLRGILAKVKQSQTALETGELVGELREPFEKVQDSVERLGQTLQNLPT